MQLPIRAAPFAHQRAAFAFASKKFEKGKGGISLLMEMGTGKTLTTIAIAGDLWQTGRIHRMLVVAPLSILGVWRQEFERFAKFGFTLTVLEGTLQKKTAAIETFTGDGLQIAIVNYESAWRLEKELLAWGADLIVADEGHKLKTHNTRASKAMHKLGAKAKYRLLLTGTPVTNKAIDVFSQYRFADPSIFGASFYSFRNRYFDMVGYGGYTPVMKKSMETELTERLHSIAFRATKEECLDLPETIDIIRPVALEPAAARLYRALVKDSFAELAQGEVTTAHVLTRLLRLSQLTGGFLNNDDGVTQSTSTAKLDMLDEIIESVMEQEQKLVVIARFLPEIDAICKLLDKRQIQHSRLTGDTPDRDGQVQRFQTDPDTKVFVGQIATAGLGITLTAASVMAFYSVDYSMSNYEQAKARIHRVGQTRKCTYLYLVAQGTVDEKVLKALRDKADLAKLLVDDYRKGLNPFDTKEDTDG